MQTGEDDRQRGKVRGEVRGRGRGSWAGCLEGRGFGRRLPGSEGILCTLSHSQDVGEGGCRVPQRQFWQNVPDVLAGVSRGLGM